MELEHTFTVAVPVDQAWDVLQDLERIVPCMPGASLTSHNGDEFTGTVKVRLGPVTMTFAGQGRFVERDVAGRRIVVEASGKDRKGGGTARAAIRASLRDEGGQTGVDVHSDLVVTGRAAQFGRGMIAEVSNRLLGQFTDCLAAELGTGDGAAAAPAAAGGGAAAVGGTAEVGGGGGAAAAPEAGAPAESGQPGGATGQPAGTTGQPGGAAQPGGTGPPGDTGQPGAGSPARVPRQAEPIDLLGVTGIRAATVRLIPFLVVFVVGVLVGAGLVAWLG